MVHQKTGIPHPASCTGSARCTYGEATCCGATFDPPLASTAVACPALRGGERTAAQPSAVEPYTAPSPARGKADAGKRNGDSRERFSLMAQSSMNQSATSITVRSKRMITWPRSLSKRMSGKKAHKHDKYKPVGRKGKGPAKRQAKRTAARNQRSPRLNVANSARKRLPCRRRRMVATPLAMRSSRRRCLRARRRPRYL